MDEVNGKEIKETCYYAMLHGSVYNCDSYHGCFSKSFGNESKKKISKKFIFHIHVLKRYKIIKKLIWKKIKNTF